MTHRLSAQIIAAMIACTAAISVQAGQLCCKPSLPQANPLTAPTPPVTPVLTPSRPAPAPPISQTHNTGSLPSSPSMNIRPFYRPQTY